MLKFSSPDLSHRTRIEERKTPGIEIQLSKQEAIFIRLLLCDSHIGFSKNLHPFANGYPALGRLHLPFVL